VRVRAGGLAGVVACFVLSGFAALLYQTAWLRQLSLVFGTSELAVAAVLSAYMAGLALGAAAAGRWAHRVRRPVLVYGALEAGVAGSALAVPALFGLAGSLQAAVLGGQPAPPDASGLAQPLFHLGVAFFVLAVPTALMGATLPLLARHAVRSDREVGPRVALLYAANTAGAVLGAVVTGFVLLPELGLRATVWVGVGLNLAVFGLAAALARRAPPMHDRPAGVADARPGTPDHRGRALVCPLMLVSGANAFLYEVLWTRLLGHVLGGSLQAFATMLGAFLAGIALGGGLAGRLARDAERAARAFAAAQVGVAVASIGVFAWIARSVPASRAPGVLAGWAAAVLLPSTVFLGATFPLAVRILARDAHEAPAASGRVYAWNTAGAIVGAVLAGFLLIPALGFEGAVRLAVCSSLGLATAVLAGVAAAGRGAPIALAAALVAGALWYHPARPRAVIAAGGMPDGGAAGEELFYAVGRSSTVSLVASGGIHLLWTNGLPEGLVRARGSPPGLESAAWLGALPVLARPAARSVLVIGLGGGTSLEGIPDLVSAIDVVELEPEVIEANRVLASRRDRDPLADSRVRIVVNDARSALRLSRKTWDAIVSQPSHPWTAGASHLFTREFVRLARERLNPSGVFVQWMDANLVGETLLRSLAATLASEFPHVRLYRPTPVALVFLASEAPLDLEREIARSGQALAGEPRHFGRLGIASAEDLLAALALDARGVTALAAGAPPSTDDDNRMATRSRSRADGLSPEALAALLGPHDPLLDPQGWVWSELGGRLDVHHLARRLLRLGFEARAVALARALPDAAARLAVEGAMRERAGDRVRAAAAWRMALALDPGDAQSRWLLFRDQLAAPARVPPPAELPESARAVVRGLWSVRDEDWAALATLDRELAGARATDAWHADAARLRAEWRVRAPGGDPRVRAREALELVDAALHGSDAAELRRLRLDCGIALGDVDVVAESARGIARGVEARVRRASGGARVAPAEREALQRRLAAIDDALAGGIAAGHPRAREVRDHARALAARLERAD
jgi:spermidine synthase